MTRMRPLCRPARCAGIAIVEFALVAVLFLTVVFGIASYGAAFLTQQTLSRAAQEGARAMLHAQSLPGADADRLWAACAQAVAPAVDWLNDHRQRLGLARDGVACGRPEFATCQYDASFLCASINVGYPDYRRYPLIPELLPLGAWMGGHASLMPQHLNARATVQLGRVGGT